MLIGLLPLRAAPGPGEPVAVTAEPIRAQSGSAVADGAPTISLGLGLAVLAAGLLIWWRGR